MENIEALFDYVFVESYNNIDYIMNHTELKNILDNDKYYNYMINTNPNVDNKILKAYSFSIIYILALLSYYNI
ncbi:hypothetical protein Catovirus_2_137 [Catovirus CTV1]|uniref:Uncharacterized protein n=1 Tax=Catovirus CTV1 TaxID=1977631 RepID=A0A1V0SC12_9VIRU|nr:hypothetical protein Catovirus_2_137 [Catovirus CTV1]